VSGPGPACHRARGPASHGARGLACHRARGLACCRGPGRPVCLRSGRPAVPDRGSHGRPNRLAVGSWVRRRAGGAVGLAVVRRPAIGHRDEPQPGPGRLRARRPARCGCGGRGVLAWASQDVRRAGPRGHALLPVRRIRTTANAPRRRVRIRLRL
jgi:hypothetical protein